MHESQKGHLYSIDLPPYDIGAEIGNLGRVAVYTLEDGQKHHIGEQYSTGDLVPEYLKERWTLICGDATERLPTLLPKLEKISLFLHDSLHTYKHMLFEYETAWPHITKNGFLISHDILWNKAFLDFSKKVGRKYNIYYGLGVVRK